MVAGLRNPEVIPDDFLLKFGQLGKSVATLRSSSLLANTALTGVLVGTPVSLAMPAGTLILSNILADGDLVFAVQTGGNSWEGMRLDASASELVFSKTVSLGANKLSFTNGLIKTDGSYDIQLRNAADSAYANLRMNNLFFGSRLIAEIDGGDLSAPNVDTNYFLFKCRDNGVGVAEVARIQGAADPYFQVTLPMVLNPSAQPGASVEGHFWYDSVAKKLKFYNGTGVETVTSG